MEKVIPICFILIVFACSSSPIKADSETKGSLTENTAIGKKTTYSSEDNPQSAALLPVSTRFYNEVCLSQLASPSAVLNESGYYVLDLVSYKSALQKTGIFTDRFIAMQDDVFDECKCAFEKEQITEADALEGGIEMNAPVPCSFLDYAYYFQAQEYPDSFRLKNSSITATTAFTEMHFYTNERNWDDEIYLEIELKKLNGEWCIDNVEKKL